MAIRFEVRDRLFAGYDPTKARAGTRKPSEWATVVKKGALWQNPKDGTEIEMFRINVFALAIDRTTRIVKKWEKEKLIPRPLWLPQGEACTHWYSAAQVVNCHRIMRYRYGGKKYMHEREEFERFLGDLRAVWYMESVNVREDGLIVGVDAVDERIT